MPRPVPMLPLRSVPEPVGSPGEPYDRPRLWSLRRCHPEWGRVHLRHPLQPERGPLLLSGRRRIGAHHDQPRFRPGPGRVGQIPRRRCKHTGIHAGPNSVEDWAAPRRTAAAAVSG